ncbi:hypothetical protein KGF56_002123 [Candida oxycetoniae]|uniref:FAS1 domain-containing protein n=1 Tax=Candida oxycetoniae TaxID=497107 RepID=A0AAI9WYA5_9ASCO|nr:uncharacterized protein KGF56_002123 [Candida oxycetoniae]KAI3405167.2 hypothetical protein KGF56_002123 [Candida oxycetoniae]
METTQPTESVMVDILSSQPQFSYFLRHLQRHGMIPKLNLMQNVTLLAPVNSAFASTNEEKPREINELLRYVVNQKVVVGNLTNEEVVYDTLYKTEANRYYPIKITADSTSKEYIIDETASIVEEDLYAKHQWSYVQGIDRLLPLKPSLCDVLMGSKSSEISLVHDIFQSLFKNDSGTTRETTKTNAKKQGKNRENKDKDKDKDKEKPLIPATCQEFLHGVKTLIIPDDKLLKNSMTSLQLEYYLANTAANKEFKFTDDATFEIKMDTLNLLKHLMFSDYIDGINGTCNKSTSFAGQKYQFSNEKGKLVLEGSYTATKTHVLSNGIVQIFSQGKQFFSRLNIPVAEMIARKALYAAQYSNFVDELKYRSLDYLVDGSAVNQTILVSLNMRDDVDEDEALSASFSLKQDFLYHFVDQSIDFSNEHNHLLVNTKLYVQKKIGGCYKMKVSRYYEDGGQEVIRILDGTEILRRIPISNNSQIFIANDEISTPANLKHSLGDMMSTGTIPDYLERVQIDRQDCLRTLNYLSTFDLYSLKENYKGYTIFLPCGAQNRNSSPSSPRGGLWDSLGLVLNYLESNPDIFEEIMRGMFFEKILYSDFQDSTNLNDINGQTVAIKSVEIINETNYVEINSENPIPIPLNSDILFNEGVIHVIDKVLIPDSFYIPIQELIKVTFDKSFPNYSISKLLEYFPKIENSLTGKKPFSLFVPSSESLENFNITSSFTDLFEFLQFHLIPNEEVYKILDCFEGKSNGGELIKTNLTHGGLVCKRKEGTNKIYLKFHKLNDTESGEKSENLGASFYNEDLSASSYNKDREVQILSHGCTSQYRNKHDTQNLSCIFLLEKPLNLDWVKDRKNRDNFLHIHLGMVSVGVGIILGLTIFGGVMLGLVFCMGRKEHRYKGDDDEIPRMDSGFMSVLTDDDEFVPYDRGYETDIDLLRSESDALLPARAKKSGGNRKISATSYNYGSIKNGRNRDRDGDGDGDENENRDKNYKQNLPATLPRDIGNIKRNLNRERNIPGLSQF